MSGFGGVVSFEIDGDRQKTSEFVDAVCLPYMGCAGRAPLLSPGMWHRAGLSMADRLALQVGWCG